MSSPFETQAGGGEIGHLLIGNVINSAVTNRHVIIFISSRWLGGDGQREAPFGAMLGATQIHLRAVVRGLRHLGLERSCLGYFDAAT